jgi:putative salt-induced outer membrane protein
MIILNFPHVKVFRISSLSRNAPASGARPDVRPEQSLGHLLWERKTTMKTNLILAAVIAGFVATTVAAQTTTFDNRGAAETFNDDLDEQMEDDRDRDLTGFGTEGRELGDYGSIALRYTSTSNDGDTSNDLGVGLRYGWFDGVNGIDTNASYAYGETNGVISENRFLGGVDYRRNLSDTFFAYSQTDVSIDKQTTTAGEYTQNIFASVGVGYRIFNSNDTQWSIQAGPGYRSAEVVGGATVNEAAASISSNLYASLTDTVYITNDTDVIYSDFATTLSNDLALNVALTDTLALRTSYATRFNDQTDNSFSDGENTFGVSAVYNFN